MSNQQKHPTSTQAGELSDQQLDKVAGGVETAKFTSSSADSCCICQGRVPSYEGDT